jgi:hypothetical protein
MNVIRHALLCSLLSLFVVASLAPHAEASDIDFSRYAAIAYSPATGNYGYAWNHHSRSSAERAALANCKEGDARIVGWVKGGWLAVAIGKDNAYGMGYEYGNGAANVDAIRRALKGLKDNSSSDGRPTVVICVCSGNIAPRIVKYDN